MKLQVPYHKQTTELNCGPNVLRMVLHYLEKDYSIEALEKIVEMHEGKAVSTIRLAISAAKLGFPVSFFSKSLYSDESHKKLDFYKRYGESEINESKKLVEEAKIAGVKLKEKSISLNEVLSYLTKDSIPILLLDWNIINTKPEKGYQGHFVPLIGYSKQSVYVHSQFGSEPAPFLEIKKEIFDKARKARGTDEDIAIIYRKNSL